MGWPAITSLDLLIGGPSLSLSAVGARVLVNFDDNWSVLAGIFEGNQAGPGSNDPERNCYGLSFRVSDPPLLRGQLQYSWNNKKGDPRLAGSVKLGAWQSFGTYSDLRYATNGISLATPMASQPAAPRRDSGLWDYLNKNSTKWQFRRSWHREFGRVSGSPSLASLIDLYADGEPELVGLYDVRPNDKFGIAMEYAHARRPQELDSDFANLDPR